MSDDGKMGLKETVGFWKEAWQGMPTVKDATSELGRGVSSWGRGISDKVSKGYTGFTHSYDDGIIIPEGTKTMLGKDFSELYVSASLSNISSTNGTGVNQIVSDRGYGTEMMSANLTSTSGNRSVATLTPEQRAAYEIVLLTKKCASQYSPNAKSSNDALAQSYADSMVEYRAACEGNGISWQRVMSYASWELQTQSMEYRDDAKGLYHPENSENERVLSNRAHAMMLQCAPDGWQDTLLPHLSGRISYEETLDMSKQDVGFLKNIGAWFKEKWEKVVNFVTSPWRALKASIPGMVDTADALIEAGNEIHEQNVQSYKDAMHDAQETVGKWKDKVTPIVDKVKDKGSELYDKAKDYLGDIMDGDEASPEVTDEPQK